MNKTDVEYNISKSTPPGMPNLVRGTKCMLFLLSKVSKDMHQSIVPILFSLLESHASGAKFMRLDRKWKEMCGMMGNLVADRRHRKGPTVMTCGNHLSRLPPARWRGTHEACARTRHLNMPKVEMAARMCDGYRKTAKWLTSREARLIVDYLGEPPGSPWLPNNMWNRMESCWIVWNRTVTYWIVWLPSALVVPLSCDWKARRKSFSQ